MALKHNGILKHETNCTASSIKKARTLASLGIMQSMFGKDKKWKEVMDEQNNLISQKRIERNAGERVIK